MIYSSGYKSSIFACTCVPVLNHLDDAILTPF